MGASFSSPNPSKSESSNTSNSNSNTDMCLKKLEEVSDSNHNLNSKLQEAALELGEEKNAKKNDFSDATIGDNNANQAAANKRQIAKKKDFSDATIGYNNPEQVAANNLQLIIIKDRERAETEKRRKTERVEEGYIVYNRITDTLTINKPNGQPLVISGFKTSQNDNKDNLMFECLYPRDYPPNYYFTMNMEDDEIQTRMNSTFICKGGDILGLSLNSLKLATGEIETTDTSYIESITIRNPTMIDVNTKQSISDIQSVTIWGNKWLGKTEAKQAAIAEAVNSIKITPRKDTEEYKKQQAYNIAKKNNGRGGKRIKRKTKRRRNSKGKSKRNTVRFNQ